MPRLFEDLAPEFYQAARHARAFAALAVTALPILWERRGVDDAADELASLMLVARTHTARLEAVRKTTQDAEVKRLIDEGKDALDAAARYQRELQEAQRALQNADRGRFAV